MFAACFKWEGSGVIGCLGGWAFCILEDGVTAGVANVGSDDVPDLGTLVMELTCFSGAESGLDFGVTDGGVEDGGGGGGVMSVNTGTAGFAAEGAGAGKAPGVAAVLSFVEW